MGTISITEGTANLILGWYPWVSNRQVLDRMLERKIRQPGGKEFGVSEATIALRWYCQVPTGFQTPSDHSCAAALRRCLDLEEDGQR